MEKETESKPDSEGQNPIWPGEGAKQPGEIPGPKDGEKTIVPEVR